MDELLSTAMRRRLHILTLLYNATDNWVTPTQLMTETKASKKTIFTDLEYIDERWGGTISIEYRERYGVRLQETHKASIHDIFIETLKESNSFRLLEGIFFDNQKYAEHWKRTLFLSTSSLYRVTQKITQFFATRKFILRRTPYQIEGADERRIRFFFKRFFLETYGIHGWPFPFERDDMFALVHKIKEEFQLTLSELEIVDMTFALAITFVRMQQGYIIEGDANEKPEHQELFKKISSLQELLEKHGCTHGEGLPINWEKDVVFSIFWWEFAWDNAQEKKRLEKIAVDFVAELDRKTKINLSEDSRKLIVNLFLRMYKQHKISPYPRFIFYSRMWFNRKIIERRLPQLCAIIKEAVVEVERKTGIPWCEYYYNHLLTGIIFNWYDLPKEIEKSRRKIKICVLSDLGKPHAKSLANYLKSVFYDLVEITYQEFFNYHLDEMTLPEADMYVTTFSLKKVPPEKIFVLQDSPSYKDISELGHKIEMQRRLVGVVKA